ncbi:hypothetical protein AX14_010731 [Amanita brunnescens Koide BX004]|nr:hypothetical protein AX14_010731 [Amanita brunnescens Koide BX004]
MAQASLMLLFPALLVFILCTSAIAAPVAAPVKLDSIAFTTSINEAISNIHPGTNHADYLHKSRRQRMSGYWRVRIKRTVKLVYVGPLGNVVVILPQSGEIPLSDMFEPTQQWSRVLTPDDYQDILKTGRTPDPMINVKKEYEADLMMFWYCTKEEPELVIGITTVKGHNTPEAELVLVFCRVYYICHRIQDIPIERILGLTHSAAK